MKPSVVNAAGYQFLADQHRPTTEVGFAAAVLQLARQGLTPRDIGQHLRLDPGAVRRLLTRNGDATMTINERTSPAAAVGGPNRGDLEEREAARQAHATSAAGNVLKYRQPSEVLTPDERATIDDSEGAQR